MRCTIVWLIEDQDMRLKHELRTCPKAKRLKRGELIAALNTARTMSRIIDWELGVHDYYAPDGEYFDVESIRELMKSGLHVDIDLGKHIDRDLRAVA